MAELNKAARNERRKLTATFTNGVAIALVAVGAIAPVFQFFSSTGNPTLSLFAVVVVCIVFAFALHLYGRYMLKGIEE